MNKPIKTPGPDHPMSLVREAALVRVLFEGHILGQSTDVLVLHEAGLPPVRYFPRADIETAFLHKTGKTSHCAYKGEAAHFTINRDGQIAQNAVWSYETPPPAMAQLTGRLAFYPEEVVFEVQSMNSEAIARTILHTDAGAGVSQDPPWAPTSRPEPGEPPYRGVGSI
jgi:uncharacterized protein (DUF427 family)